MSKYIYFTPEEKARAQNTDKKGAYRNSAENLKSELSEYCAKTGRYSSVEDSERNAIFSEAMERIIKQGYSKIASLENNASGKS